MEPLRIGILGAAHIAPRAIVEPANEVGARLVVVAARDEARARYFADANGVERVADSYEDVIADPEVEVVYNPLPNGLHAPWNLAALAAGKHVLSEKPFAADADEAREVRDAARAAGLVAADGFHYRYHPTVLRALELVGTGAIGDLRRVTASMTIPAPGDDNLRWSLPLAGGALMDLGCYSLHVHRLLGAVAGGGEPTVVAATAVERAGHPGVDEKLAAQMAFPSGATGVAQCDMDGGSVEMSVRVEGSAGELLVPRFCGSHQDDRVVVRDADGERVEHGGTRSSYSYQLDAVTAAVREGAPLPTDADDAVATMELIDAAYAAAGLPPRPRSPR